MVAVCTKDRVPWLASPEVHLLVREVWQEADAWLVGRYVVMPDHVHLFAGYSGSPLSLDAWVRFWKSQVSRRHRVDGHRWQQGYWDTRLRSWESYESKWEYVRGNPVRHGLAERPEDWPYQGEIHALAL